jgi:Zn finger protein HypA/HybF involved in hydrogenase expression
MSEEDKYECTMCDKKINKKIGDQAICNNCQTNCEFRCRICNWVFGTVQRRQLANHITCPKCHSGEIRINRTGGAYD